RLGLFQNGDVGVGVFPEGEEVLMLDGSFCTVTLQGLNTLDSDPHITQPWRELVMVPGKKFPELWIVSQLCQVRAVLNSWEICESCTQCLAQGRNSLLFVTVCGIGGGQPK